MGSVIIIKPFDAARAPAIRDIGFHLVALGMLIFVVLFDGEMYWWQPFSFLVLYAIYALTVVSGGFCLDIMKDIEFFTSIPLAEINYRATYFAL